MGNRLTVYEKAMPDSLSWRERLEAAGEAGFDALELSIDESDRRLARPIGTWKSDKSWSSCPPRASAVYPRIDKPVNNAKNSPRIKMLNTRGGTPCSNN